MYVAYIPLCLLGVIIEVVRLVYSSRYMRRISLNIFIWRQQAVRQCSRVASSDCFSAVLLVWSEKFVLFWSLYAASLVGVEKEMLCDTYPSVEERVLESRIQVGNGRRRHGFFSLHRVD